MNILRSPLNQLPDISHDSIANVEGTIDRVGMGEVEMPILWGKVGAEFRQMASVDAFVSLDSPQARGIHMSRLYFSLAQVLPHQQLKFSVLQSLISEFIEKQESLSKSATLIVRTELPYERPALKSGSMGWRKYPVEWRVRFEAGEWHFESKVEIMYSSTCPCSAALARQAVQKNFIEEFPPGPIDRETIANWLARETSVVATPHAQRSFATLRIRWDRKALESGFADEPLHLIDAIEEVLQTPVQAAVKREDEQEFARRNGQNLMFCEDAVRRIKDLLAKDSRIQDFVAKVDHVESLHPHSAVAMCAKGKPGGYSVHGIF